MFKKIIFTAIFAFILILGAAAGGFSYLKHAFQPRPAPAPQPAAAPDVKITLIEGWTLNDMAGYLERHGVVPADQFLKAAADFDASQYPILESKPKTAGLEGFIFPDTYFVSGDPSTTPAELSESIVEKALNNFSKKFTGDMQAQARRGNMSVYQIVTLASIIERETGRNAVTDEQKQALDEERRIIAGIFYNRLNIGMPLESDATINFITKKNTPQATASDTAIDSPYNTYKYKGLPPGPISNPSLSSIMAALYPTKSDYYYFLHKQPSGEPVYSKTYEEHLRNKAKYLDN